VARRSQYCLRSGGTKRATRSGGKTRLAANLGAGDELRAHTSRSGNRAQPQSVAVGRRALVARSTQERDCERQSAEQSTVRSIAQLATGSAPRKRPAKHCSPKLNTLKGRSSTHANSIATHTQRPTKHTIQPTSPPETQTKVTHPKASLAPSPFGPTRSFPASERASERAA